LTFVVTRWTKSHGCYSGYRYGSPAMIYIINRVLSSNFLATMASNVHGCHPSIEHSIVDTFFRTLFRTMSRNVQSPHSASRNPLEHKDPRSSVNHFHPWIFSKLTLLSVHTTLLKHLWGFTNSSRTFPAFPVRELNSGLKNFLGVSAF